MGIGGTSDIEPMYLPNGTCVKVKGGDLFVADRQRRQVVPEPHTTAVVADAPASLADRSSALVTPEIQPLPAVLLAELGYGLHLREGYHTFVRFAVGHTRHKVVIRPLEELLH